MGDMSVRRTGIRLGLTTALTVIGLGFGLGPGAGKIPAASAAVSPIQPGNVPTAIPGATNGELPPSDLVSVAPGCQAARAAGPSLGLLLAEARDRGVLLGTEECYRSLAGEVAESQAWTAAGNSACAAPVVSSPAGHPVGTSIHGWGKAADLFDSRGTVAFGFAGLCVPQGLCRAGRLEPPRLGRAGRERLPGSLALGVGR